VARGGLDRAKISPLKKFFGGGKIPSIPEGQTKIIVLYYFLIFLRGRGWRNALSAHVG